LKIDTSIHTNETFNNVSGYENHVGYEIDQKRRTVDEIVREIETIKKQETDNLTRAFETVISDYERYKLELKKEYERKIHELDKEFKGKLDQLQEESESKIQKRIEVFYEEIKQTFSQTLTTITKFNKMPKENRSYIPEVKLSFPESKTNYKDKPNYNESKLNYDENKKYYNENKTHHDDNKKDAYPEQRSHFEPRRTSSVSLTFKPATMVNSNSTQNIRHHDTKITGLLQNLQEAQAKYSNEILRPCENTTLELSPNQSSQMSYELNNETASRIDSITMKSEDRENYRSPDVKFGKGYRPGDQRSESSTKQYR